MQDYDAKIPAETIRVSTSAKYKYNLYARIDYITIDENYINTLPENIVAGGTKIELYSNNYLKSPQDTYCHYIVQTDTANCGFVKILPHRLGPIYLNTYIDTCRDLEKIYINDKILQKQFMALCKRLGICPHTYDIGNIYVCSYHPIFKNIDVIRNGNAAPLLLIRERKDNPTRHYTISYEIREQDMFPIEIVRCFIEGKDKYVIPKVKGLTTMWNLRVYDNAERLLYNFAELHPISGSVSNMRIHSHDLVVRNGAHAETIQKYSNHRIHVGDRRGQFDVSTFFYQHYRKTPDEGIDDEYMFVKGTNADPNALSVAENFVRRILNQADQICYICDPYFSLESLKHVLRIENDNVEVRVLASADGYATANQENITKLSECVEQYNNISKGKIHIRILKTEKISLHDRYIVLERKSWHLGTSLNNIGKKCSAALLVPERYHDDLLECVESWWNGDDFSEPLKEFLKRKIT